MDDEKGNEFLAAVHLDNVSVTYNRDSKIHYGEVLLRLREVKFTSGNLTSNFVRMLKASVIVTIVEGYSAVTFREECSFVSSGEETVPRL